MRLYFQFRIPDQLFQEDVVVLVGRLNVDTKYYEGRAIVEGIAIIPWNNRTNSLDLENILLEDNKEHNIILDEFKPNGMNLFSNREERLLGLMFNDPVSDEISTDYRGPVGN